MAMALDCRNLSKNVMYVIQYYQSLLGGGGGGGGGVLEDVALEFCNKKECYICDVCQYYQFEYLGQRWEGDMGMALDCINLSKNVILI